MKEITTIKLTKKTVEILNKLKIHPRQAYEEVILKLLKKSKFDKKSNKKGNHDLSSLMFLFIAGMILISGLFLIKGGITGQVVFSEENYVQQLNLEANNISEYIWILEERGDLKNIRLSGYFEQNTSAKVYIEHNSKKYLILDINKLNNNGLPITGLVIEETKETTKINETITQITNETADISVNNTINIDLEYKSGSIYDKNDDGIETLTGVVDLTVENSEFNWDVDESKLCTRWDTYSIENDESTVVCYGSSRCCEFVDLSSTRSDWNEPFYSAYGQYGATSDNTVSAQVLYVDYNLSLIDPYSEIYYSDWNDLSVNYHAPTISFEGICVETCSLENFNESQYRLIIEVDNGFLKIDTVEYTTIPITDLNITQVALNTTPINVTQTKITEPILIKNISNLSIIKNNNYTINLENYFSNIDDTTIFTYFKQDNINIVFENNIATIVPDKGFIGTRTTFITANRSNKVVVSNVFTITVTNKKIKDCSNFIRTDDGQYYCADDERYYSCKAFEDVGDLTRCTEAKYLRNTISKSMCPFKHKDCNVTVDIDKGWGSRQSDEKRNYKLSTFKKNFYCGGGHCEIPFFFKSKVSLSGKLDFNVTSNVLLKNILIKRVLKSGEVGVGNQISMKQHDSYYYLAYFDYESEWTDGKIRTKKPVKFNITASLDGIKILELDPIAFESSNNAGSIDIRDVAIPAISITCNSGDVIIVGVTLETGGTPTVDYNGVSFDSINETISGSLELEMFNLSKNTECSGTSKNVNVAVSGGGNNKDAVATVVVYSGVDTIDMTTVSRATASASTQISNTVTTAASGDFAIDVIGYLDSNPDSAITPDGDNSAFNRTADGGADIALVIGGASDDGGLIGGTATLSWSSDSSTWASIGVALVAPPAGDVTAPEINGTINNTAPQQGFIINVTFNMTDDFSSINGTIVINNTGGNRYFNFSFVDYATGTTQQMSQNFTISEAVGTVINITGIAIDNNSNRAQNDTIITVAAPPDITSPIVNATLNRSLTNIRRNDVINITANATDAGGTLATCTFFINDTSTGSFRIEDKTLGGTEDQCSQNWTVSLTKGNVINFSVLINDTATPPNTAMNDTIITVVNTPPATPTIVFPDSGQIFNSIPIDLNVTVDADADSDTITINYYIDGKINGSVSGNLTFNASDGIYLLNISSFDTEDSSANTTTINFTLDLTVPIVNATLNESLISIKQNDVINLTANATDERGLSFGQIIVNDTGSERIFSFALDGATSAEFSQNITVACNGGCVINFTARVNDTAGNFRTNDTIITVIDETNPPIVNATLNISLGSIRINDVINITANATDVGGGLETCTFFMNGTTGGSQKIEDKSLDSSTEDQCSQNWTVDLSKGSVINFSVLINDTATPPNTAMNDTIITVVNTPPDAPTINAPTDEQIFNSIPIDLNVTFNADADGDSITINYYIDGKINTSGSSNTTFNASDGVYLLNISLFDGEDSSTNVSINFTLDTTVPVVNATLNESLTNIGFGDVINLTANATDDRGLSFGQIIVNDTGSNRIFSFDLGGATSAEFSQNITVSCNGGCVINFTARVNDTAGNFRTNDTIITIVDKVNPVVNATLNKSLSSIFETDVINITANATDNIGLSFGQIIVNDTGFNRFFNFSLGGSTGTVQFSQNITISCSVGCVINFTARVNDTSNRFTTNDTIITVVSEADNDPPIANATLNSTTIRINDVINITVNATDVGGGLDTCRFFLNDTSDGSYRTENESFATQPTSGQCSQNWTVRLAKGNVINFSVLVNDTSTDLGGGNLALNDTIITVANTEPTQPNIKNVTNRHYITNITINITPSTDADSDTLTYFWFRNTSASPNPVLVISGTTTTNLTTRITSGDGTYWYFVNVSDGDVNVTGDLWNLTLDATIPIVNATLNESLTNIGINDVINITANATDNIGLSFGQIIVNDTGFVRFFNFSLGGATTAEFSQNITISCNGGCVINFTARVNDSAGNFRTNDTIITVVDKVNPVVNATLNKSLSSIFETDVINITANATDNIGLSFGQIIVNDTGGVRFFNFSLDGATTAEFSQNITISCSVGCVINFTARVNDTSNRFTTNDTIITVAAAPDTTPPIVNATLNRSLTNIRRNDVINITANATDVGGGLDTCQFFLNDTTDGSYRTENKTLSGTDDQCSQNWTVRLIKGDVINFSVLVNDTSTDVAGGNTVLNDTIITVADFIATVSIGVNNSAIKINDVVNVSSNTTDQDDLSFCLIKTNQTGAFLNETQNLSGTTDTCSSAVTISVVKGNVVNFTIEINDTVGDIIYRTSTKITVVNTPPDAPTINFPTDEQIFNSIPIDLNVTFNVDADGDAITINYYIDGKINTSGSSNTTFNASDGVYLLNISLFDGEDSSANVSINFTLDLTVPIVNATLNESLTDIGFGDVINLTANATDDRGLSFGQIIVNDTGSVRTFSFALDGATTGTFSQNITVSCNGGCVINFTARVNDTAGNFRTNDTIISVADKVNPVVNATLNKSLSSIFETDVINITANVTDEVGLSFGQIIVNDTGSVRTFSFDLGGATEAEFSQNITVSCATGCVINFTARANDTTNNFRTNDTIIEVSLFVAGDSTKPIINGTLNNTAPLEGEVINATFNATDEINLTNATIAINDTGFFRYFNFSFEGNTVATTIQFSQNFTVSCGEGCVISVKGTARDNSSNEGENETIIIVPDLTKPRINASISNISAPRKNDVVNFTANVSDSVGLDTCSFYMNGTSDGSFIILNKTVTGKDDQCSQNWTVILAKGSVINFTVLVNDTSNNLNQSEQIITVADFIATVSIGVNNSAPKINDVVNVSSNATDQDDLSFCLIKTNQTGAFLNTTIELSGTSDSCNDSITISVVKGNVVNFTIEINDSVGDVIYRTSTKVTIVNTPPDAPTINAPTDEQIFNSIPIDLNVTFNVDADGDAITINYYIDGKINTSGSSNTTFNASDGVYLLNISLFDGEDSSANVSINFTLDLTVPIVNATLNESLTDIGFGDVINLTANATDERGLSFGQIIVNDTGSNRIFNFSLGGATTATFSQNITVSCNGGCVINFTARVNDTAGNFRTNDTIISVADKVNPVVNATLNKSLSSIFETDVINITANATDNIGLSFGQIIVNDTGFNRFFNFSLGGSTGTVQFSQNITISCSVGCVINFTARVNDTSNRFTTNDTIITVADNVNPVVNATLNESLTNIAFGDVINITANATDETGLSFGQIIVNDTGGNRFFNFSLSGTEDTFSQNFTISCTRGCVINVTALVNDTSNNKKQNETIFTVANTPPSGLSIVFPTDNSYVNKQPLDLNVTFDADADSDAITINYYIDGKINGSVSRNLTFNASDKTYNLNVSLFDGTDSSANISINFTLDTVAPNVTLIGPANDTIDIDGNISFSYNVTDAFPIGNCTLIFNNNINLTNNSIIDGTRLYFNLTDLPAIQYNWSVNCSDRATNVKSSKERSISVIIFKKFNGSTTDFTTVNIRNITNLTIENTAAGKINFTQSIDLSGGADLNKYVNISFNRIEINSSALPALNKSAILVLYGLTFSKPRILRDENVCPSSICTEISFTGGNLTFNVTQFTVYSAEETSAGGPAAPGGGGGGGGAGGGGGFVLSKGFSLDKNVIKESILQGGTKTTEFEIKNTGEIKLQFSIEIQDLDGFVSISEDSFELEPNETKTITVSITVSENEIADVYSGRIKIKGNGIEKNVITIIEVIEKKPLFDINVIVDEDYKKVLRAQEVKFEINLLNLGTLKPVDVELYYAIKDLNENIISFKTESLAIDDEISVKRILSIPKNIEFGDYIIYSRVSYKGQIAASSDLFEIVEILPKAKIKIKSIVALILALIAVSILFTVIGMHYMEDIREGRLQRKLQELLIGRRKEKPALPKEGFGKIVKIIDLVWQKLGYLRKIASGKEIEAKKLLTQVEEWKRKGYDTSMLELDIKALENKEFGKILKRLKEWKNKGYDTTILELKIKALGSKELGKMLSKLEEWKKKGYDTFLLEEKIMEISGDGKKSLDIIQLETKIRKWKEEGYNTSILEEKLEKLKNKQKQR